MGVGGIERLREQGSSKLRIPPGSHEAILINTSGGLAGGDHLSVELQAGSRAQLTVTTQAAERVYRSLGPAADVQQVFAVADGARLLWLPHETILFDGAVLHRRIDVEVAPGGWFLGLEASVYGRAAMGETISSLHHREDWRIRSEGKLIHAENWRLDGGLPQGQAALRGNSAIATLILIAPDAESHLATLRAAHLAASAWNGKLVARFVGRDGFTLRKQLVAALSAIVGSDAVPKVWTL
jgi:urease accessory protein